MDDTSFLQPSIMRERSIEPNWKNPSLTPLEKRIIALVLAGYTNKESAKEIGVSEQSVGQHLRDVTAKLRVANQLELILFALYHHLIDPLQISPRKCPRVTEVRLSQTPHRKVGYLMSRAATTAVVPPKVAGERLGAGGSTPKRGLRIRPGGLCRDVCGL